MRGDLDPDGHAITHCRVHGGKWNDSNLRRASGKFPRAALAPFTCTKITARALTAKRSEANWSRLVASAGWPDRKIQCIFSRSATW